MAAGHCCIFLWSIIIISAINDTINVAHAEKSSFKNPSIFLHSSQLTLTCSAPLTHTALQTPFNL